MKNSHKGAFSVTEFISAIQYFLTFLDIQNHIHIPDQSQLKLYENRFNSLILKNPCVFLMQNCD